MKTHITIHTIIAALYCGAAFGADVKSEVSETKSETKDGTTTARAEATAFAKAESRTISTTNVNGKTVTIIEEPDENGKLRRKMITYSPSGRPKVKDITPKEKKPAEKADPFDQTKPSKK